MSDMIDRFLSWMDGASEKAVRRTAMAVGRRNVLATLGTAMMGTALAPMLPFDRTFGKAFAQTPAGEDGDVTQCDYWRYCALDGYLCSECGGTLTECTPGSVASTVAWVGTCRNPNDDRDYLVSYNDCCGGGGCVNPTFCFTSQGERPGYRMGLYNDINWCMANETKGYHCTVAVVVGLA
ncbi:MAG: amine dehydrogenase [Bauldia sp.]|nr:amine dehydrogenase [Bauldia sp.]MCW5718486.1 amine dehydrogenase [Bauldia sp.]